MFDFDHVVNRRGTHSAKWDMIKSYGGIAAADALPLWVADMDFQAPPGVTAALREELDRATHGYYADTGTWGQSIIEWFSRRHNLKIEPSWISATPGIVTALALVLQACTEPGDDIVMFPPIYHVFRQIVPNNGRNIIDVQLVEENGRYVMDFDALAAKVTSRTKAVFFCSPHNPGGTCWRPDQIRALAEFCASRNILLVSDEIHCDLILPGAHHTPTLVAAPACADHVITCVAATKTFNLAGAHTGAMIVSNVALKAKLDKAMLALGLYAKNSFGMIATEAAWRTGGSWLDALLPYLAKNRDELHRRIEIAVPGARAMPLDATYLAWIDFTQCSLTPAEIQKRVAERARLFVSNGPQFGPGGAAWLRINFATPRPVLDEALTRFEDAFADVR